MNWSFLDGMTMQEQKEHLMFMVEELLSPVEPFNLDCLTAQQSHIVGRLLHSKGRVVPCETLRTAAHSLWTEDYFISYAVLKTQISKARRRLAAAGSPIRIETVRGIGYRAVVE